MAPPTARFEDPQPAAPPRPEGPLHAATADAEGDHESHEGEDPSRVHDDVPEDELSTFPKGPQQPRPHPFDALTEKTLQDWLRHSPAKLGSLSIGRPNGGALINAVPFPPSDLYTTVAPGTAYATQETVDYLTRSLARVHNAFSNCPKLAIGDVSAKNGGHLSPHLSHQAGRDVDISYYYSDASPWYTAATADNLDTEKTWAFIHALAVESDVEMILIDASIQAILRDYAEKAGEDPTWVEDLFRGTPGVRPPLIRHVKGHRTHIHIRFYNPIAQESARRLHPLLVKYGKIRPRAYTLNYTAKPGDSLNLLAAKFGTTVKALRRANRLKGTKLYAKRVYAIPRTGTLPSPEVVVPPRRIPNSKPQSISSRAQHATPPT